ncbi:MAG: oxidoreductase, partial [Egibacteraceae bacterium]
TFINPDGYALFAANLAVGQSMLCRNGFHAHGEVRLNAAHIGGALDCTGGTFTRPFGYALNAYGLTVENMHCTNGFHAQGDVSLFGADIGGVLAFDRGIFISPNRAAPLLEGTVDLTHARVGLLIDTEESWPAALRLDGLVYDSIRAIPEVTVEQRLGWLTRDPDGCSPQKYEQLAAFYRRAGHEQEARQVAVAKQRARRQTLPRPARLWSRLLEVTVGYGYQPWRALWWLAGFVAVGALLFAHAYPQALTATAPAGQLPVFQPVVYALDVLLPIVDLRQQDFWIPNAARPWGWAYLGWFWLSIAAGWVLTTAVAAAVAGLLKTDSRLG